VLATGAVTTLVGIAGAPGSSDGTGAEAQFNYPQGIAADGAGNLYVADSANHIIRKVVVATATVTTIAGLVGMPGSADGPGTAARFNYPSAVVLDSAGKLYIADRNNSVVRQIVLATGMVSTIAGTASMSSGVDGASATARFNMPAGAASDSAGNLYIADTGDSTLRQVVMATGAVSTLAGTAGLPGSTSGTGPAARFRNPEGVATDGTGNLYVADTGNSLIRKVVLATGAASTLAGAASMQGSTDGIGGAARFNNPEGVAIDGTGNLYVADTGNSLIRKIVLATGAVSTLAGTVGMQGSADGIGTTAQFRSPKGIAADGMGNLYIADTNNYTLRKIVLATAAVSTVAGGTSMPGSADGTGTTARFNLPRGLAVDGLGNLYVSDTGNATIRKFTPANASVTTLAGKVKAMGVVLGPLPGGLNQPTALTVTLTGELIIADGAENAVLAVR
jgi:sugar lactone lactonase YvrE